MAVIWNTSCRKCIIWARDIKSFFLLLLYQLPGHAIFFEFLVSVINPYHINGLHLFWNSFEWFCLYISRDPKYFSSLVQCILIIVVIIHYFQIWSKKEHDIIISRVISRHMGPVYIDTPSQYIYICVCVCGCLKNVKISFGKPS